MRYVRFRTVDEPRPRWGVREGDTVIALTGPPWVAHDRVGAVPASAIQLLAPAEPTKLLALGYNYKALFGDPAALANKREAHYTHAGFEPLMFLKGPNAVADPGAVVRLPRGSEVWIEVEVTAIIGRRVRNLRDAAAAREAVAGLTIGNDITALNILGRDWHLARSKSLDGFCPLGPELVTDLDDRDLAMTTTINGRTTQWSSSSDRVLDTYEAVALASRIMTLEPGDALLTGTPLGGRQSVVVPGDSAELSISGLGMLVSTFEEESV